MAKPRIIKDYDKLSEAIQGKIKLFYPHGFDKKLIMFKNAKNKLISALPFEAETYFYLVKMTKQEAQAIISRDEDYGEDGLLKEDSIPRLEKLKVEPPRMVEVKKPEPVKAKKGKSTKGKTAKAKADKTKTKKTKTKKAKAKK